jgi:hypothetical protein
VCTAPGTAMGVRCHRRFYLEKREIEGVTAMVTGPVMAVHSPFYLESRVFEQLAMVAPPCLVQCHRRLSGAPTAMTVRGAPPPHVRCHTNMSGALIEISSKG